MVPEEYFGFKTADVTRGVQRLLLDSLRLVISLQQNKFENDKFKHRLYLFISYLIVSAYSPTIPSLHLRHSSFFNPSLALPTSQLILQPFRCFTYVTTYSPTLPLLHLRHWAHSPTFPSLYLCHNSFSNPSVVSPTSQLILQLFRHSSFSKPPVASPTSQFILQPSFRFS